MIIDYEWVIMISSVLMSVLPAVSYMKEKEASQTSGEAERK